jgi:hypothetical protein
LGETIHQEYLKAWNILDLLNLNILFQFNYALRIVRIDLLHLFELFLPLILRLPVTHITKPLYILHLQVINLFLEYLINLLLIHLPLLFGCKPDPPRELLHFTLGTLGHRERRPVTQECHHLPPAVLLYGLLLVA